MERTGHADLCTTFSVTLPISMWRSPVLPWVDMTINLENGRFIASIFENVRSRILQPRDFAHFFFPFLRRRWRPSRSYSGHIAICFSAGNGMGFAPYVRRITALGSTKSGGIYVTNEKTIFQLGRFRVDAAL